jgi:sulfate permease, SulP family
MSTEASPDLASSGKASIVPGLVLGLIAGMDNIAAALAMGALIFTGHIAAGMGHGVAIVLLGGALMALAVAWHSRIPNSVALVQESNIAILALAVAAMVAASQGTQEGQIATAIAIMGCASLLTGLLFWITGRLKLGGLVRFLPYPVLAGFLAGSGWLLIDGAAMMVSGAHLTELLRQTGGSGQVMWLAGATITFALVMYAATASLSSPFTMPVVMLAAVTAFYATLWTAGISLDAARDLGQLPRFADTASLSLPSPALFSQVDWWQVLNAAPSMVMIAIISMVGLMLNISGLELAMGKDVDVNAELRSNGIANLLSGGVGGPAGYTGLSMTIMAQETGATSRLPGVATAAVMIAGLAAASSLLIYVPTFLTAGFVLFMGMSLLNNWFIRARRQLPVADWLIIGLIVATIALVGFLEGLIAGLIVSAVVFVLNYARLPVIRLNATGIERRSTVDRASECVKYLSSHGGKIQIVQLQGYLFFGTADRVVNIIRKRVVGIDEQPLRFVLLDFHHVSGADSAAITCFVKILRLVRPAGVTVVFTHLHEDIERQLVLAGNRAAANELVLMPDLDGALEMAEESILSERGETGSDKTLLHHLGAIVGEHPRLPDLINAMTRQVMQPEAVLIRQGEKADDLYFLASGRVRVQVALPSGRTLRLRSMLAGAIVGEVAFYLRQVRTADVIVDMPSVVYQLKAADLAALEGSDAELAALAHRIMATTLSEKLAMANKTIQLSQA